MKRQIIEEKLIETLKEVLQMSGYDVPAIGMATRPIGDLPQFDSLNAIETVSLLSAKLNCSFKCGKRDVNLFESNADGHSLTVKEIVCRLSDLCDEGAD